tara:strand:- start:354 stop:671 length:318 start_codon:yes stop_codon:yes gene_type:complete
MELEYDNLDIIELNDYFRKVNKKYGLIDNTELPFRLIQDIYNKSGRDKKSSMQAIKRINDQIEKAPNYKKFGGGDYLDAWYEISENPFEDSLPVGNSIMSKFFNN